MKNYLIIGITMSVVYFIDIIEHVITGDLSSLLFLTITILDFVVFLIVWGIIRLINRFSSRKPKDTSVNP